MCLQQSKTNCSTILRKRFCIIRTKQKQDKTCMYTHWHGACSTVHWTQKLGGGYGLTSVWRVIGWWAGQWNWNTDTVSSGTCWRFILWYLHTRAEEKDHRPATLIPTSSSLLSPSWLGKLRLTNQLQRSNWTPDGHTEEWRHLYWSFHLDADSIL